jgi:7-methyl-GTP pyrophosphatase
LSKEKVVFLTIIQGIYSFFRLSRHCSPFEQRIHTLTHNSYNQRSTITYHTNDIDNIKPRADNSDNTPESQNMKIVLASSSKYRKHLLSQILPEFECKNPEIDEEGRASEKPQALALRLAEQKALNVATKINAPALIIGSDQVAWLNGTQLHKPGNIQNNIDQLARCSGQEVSFYTGLAVYNSALKQMHSSVEVTTTKFRTLSPKEISRYVSKEPSLDCAGGFKAEGLGISLFEEIKSRDPNTLIGLPLMLLCEFLRENGIEAP